MRLDEYFRRKNEMKKIKKLSIGMICFSAFCAMAYGADSTITGKLSVGNGVKAGTNSTTENFEFRTNGILISKGTFNEQSALLGADQGEGARLLWYSGKAAFRAGYDYNQSWDDANIGMASVAFGWGSAAIGWGSMAAGEQSFAYGIDSVSLGGCNQAVGDASTSFGGWNIAYAYASGAFGAQTVANGEISTTFGEMTKADATHSFVIGRYNVGGGNTSNWVASDPLFEIGNGTSDTTRTNALTVYKNGNVAVQGMIVVAPGGDISMSEFTATPQQ